MGKVSLLLIGALCTCDSIFRSSTTIEKSWEFWRSGLFVNSPKLRSREWQLTWQRRRRKVKAPAPRVNQVVLRFAQVKTELTQVGLDPLRSGPGFLKSLFLGFLSHLTRYSLLPLLRVLEQSNRSRGTLEQVRSSPRHSKVREHFTQLFLGSRFSRRPEGLPCMERA